MPQRTISVPQRAGLLLDPVVFEAVSRVVSGVNAALTLPTAPGAPISATGTIAPTNPVVRLIGPGTIRTVAPVDFTTPLYLIAAGGDVEIETGGNIGGAASATQGTVIALVPDLSTGLWWPIAGGGGALPRAEALVVKDDVALSVSDVVELRFEGATVEEVSAGIVKITVSSGSGAALTVKESDGTPSASDVEEIRFAGATVNEVSPGVVEVTVPTPDGGDTHAADVYHMVVSGAESTEGLSRQRETASNYTTLSADVVFRSPVYVSEIQWSVFGAATYTLTLNGESLGDYVASGTEADVPWAIDRVLCGTYTFEMTRSVAAKWSDGNLTSHASFLVSIPRACKYDGTSYAFSIPAKFVLRKAEWGVGFV